MNIKFKSPSKLQADTPHIEQAIRLIQQDGVNYGAAALMVFERYHRGLITVESMAGVWETYDLLKGLLK